MPQTGPFFDKVLLSVDGSIGGLFLLVKGYNASKSRGWRCGWEREVELFISHEGLFVP